MPFSSYSPSSSIVSTFLDGGRVEARRSLGWSLWVRCPRFLLGFGVVLAPVAAANEWSTGWLGWLAMVPVSLAILYAMRARGFFSPPETWIELEPDGTLVVRNSAGEAERLARGTLIRTSVRAGADITEASSVTHLFLHTQGAMYRAGSLGAGDQKWLGELLVAHSRGESPYNSEVEESDGWTDEG